MSPVDSRDRVVVLVVDLMLLAGVGYAVYRLTPWPVENRLPESLDVLEEDATDEDSNHGAEGGAPQ